MKLGLAYTRLLAVSALRFFKVLQIRLRISLLGYMDPSATVLNLARECLPRFLHFRQPSAATCRQASTALFNVSTGFVIGYAKYAVR
jgi:hypothetical protein